jgi:hypothetical protein
MERLMKTIKPMLLQSAIAATIALGSLAATAAHADSYVACNRWGSCWKVQDRYTEYPPEARVVIRDEAWRAAHEHDSHWRWMSDPADDKGWYDRDGNWHPFHH